MNGSFGGTAKLTAALFAAAVVLVVASATASAAKTPIYNDIPSPLPGNLASVGFQAQQTSEFGGQVEFAPGTWKNPTVTVTMSTFACVAGNWDKENCVTPRAKNSNGRSRSVSTTWNRTTRWAR